MADVDISELPQYGQHLLHGGNGYAGAPCDVRMASQEAFTLIIRREFRESDINGNPDRGADPAACVQYIANCSQNVFRLPTPRGLNPSNLASIA